MGKVELQWKRMSGEVINEPLITYLDRLLLDEYDKGLFVKVAVGTDSQRKANSYNFATVILITKHEDLGGGVIVGRGYGFKVKPDSYATSNCADRLCQ